MLRIKLILFLLQYSICNINKIIYILIISERDSIHDNDESNSEMKVKTEPEDIDNINDYSPLENTLDDENCKCI